jgi:hypothetical protein
VNEHTGGPPARRCIRSAHSVVGPGIHKASGKIAVPRASSSLQHYRGCLLRPEVSENFLFAETLALHVIEGNFVSAAFSSG